MRMNNFLLDRESVREYKGRGISRRDMRAVEELLANISRQSAKNCFDFVLFNEGRNLFNKLDGHGGYNGVMIESPHYIGVRLNEVNNESILNASYYSEELMTELMELDLGTCWVTIGDASLDIKEEALGRENKRIAYLISFGYPKPRNPFDTVKTDKSTRKSLNELVYKENIGREIDLSELEERGLDDLFYYIRFAPSSKNSQPWVFVLKNDSVELYIEKVDGSFNLMDAGIIMYYFQALAHYAGMYNNWEVDRHINKDRAVDGYKKIASFKL